MLNKTPSRYSSTQMPIAYCPGMVGVQVSSPVLGSMLNVGSAVMGLSQEKPVTYGTST